MLTQSFQAYTISSKRTEHDSYARFLHPLLGNMTQWLGDLARFDCTADGAEEKLVPGMQWSYGDCEEKVL